MISSNKKTHKKQLQYCDLIEQYKVKAMTTKN